MSTNPYNASCFVGSQWVGMFACVSVTIECVCILVYVCMSVCPGCLLTLGDALYPEWSLTFPHGAQSTVLHHSRQHRES